MQVDVIVMVEESDHSIKDWKLETDEKGKLCLIPPNEMGQMPETKWRELALDINRSARKGEHERVEIFLYLRDGLLKSIKKFGIVKKIVADARHHVWAGNVYVVWDRTRDTTVEKILQELDRVNLLVDFCSALLQERVTGLIEISRTGKAPGELSSAELRGFLRGRAVTARKRRAELKALVHEDGWSPVLRNEARDLDYLLNVFVKEARISPSAPNHLLIFEAAGQPAGVLIEKSKASRRVVAATVESYSNNLKITCDNEMPPLDILLYHSIYEVIYALLQLNDARKLEKRPENFFTGATVKQVGFNADMHVEIETVEVVEGSRFPSSTTTASLNLLITSAFDDEAEPDHSKAAAKEIGAIRGDVTSLQDVEVYPYMSCQSFPKLLDSKQYTAWIHLSHGDEGGLYDPQKDLPVSPESWLNCFRAYEGSLSLVIFSACNSAHAAKLFAKAGVGVAIGFKNKVLPAATEILAQKIVPAAMQSGGNQEAILNAFRAACRSLAARITDDGENYSDAQPIAFRSLRK